MFLLNLLATVLNRSAGEPPQPPVSLYQQWENYPDSPVLTSEYPYQCILDYGGGTVRLCLSKSPMYINNLGNYESLISVDSGLKYSLSSNTWTSPQIIAPLSQFGGATILNFTEANEDVYNDQTLNTIRFSKTTSLEPAPINPELWDGTFVNEYPNGGAVYVSNPRARTTNQIAVSPGLTYTIKGVNRLRIEIFNGATSLLYEDFDTSLPSIDKVIPQNAMHIRLYYQYDYSGTDLPSIKQKI